MGSNSVNFGLTSRANLPRGESIIPDIEFDWVEDSVMNGHTGLVRLLLKAGADADEVLSAAVYYEKVEIVKLVLARGVKQKDQLERAIETLNDEIVELLIRHGAKTKRISALQLAVNANEPQTVRLIARLVPWKRSNEPILIYQNTNGEIENVIRELMIPYRYWPDE